MHGQTSNEAFYNKNYRNLNYFNYKEWLYRPYISSLIKYCLLPKGASVLDVGCGQGFFSYQFSKHGMKTHGIDISETGIRAARNTYGRFGITFTVGDAHTARFAEPFDCVFIRSCSLYNTEIFPNNRGITDSLLRHLKPGGVLVFAYNSSFKQCATWRHHSLNDVYQHFSHYPDTRIFFLNKLTTYILRKRSFSQFLTRCNTALSNATGIGGEIVCIVRNLKCAERERA